MEPWLLAYNLTGVDLFQNPSLANKHPSYIASFLTSHITTYFALQVDNATIDWSLDEWLIAASTNIKT